MQTTYTEQKNPGVIIRLVGVVVDVEFESGDLPSIYNALLVKREGGGDLILEIQECGACHRHGQHGGSPTRHARN